MSGWVGVITNAGQAALARSIAESEELNLNAVQVGTGYVNPANMRSATHLDTQTGTGTLRNMQQVDGGVSLIVNIPAQNSAATIKEVGVFGTIDGTSVLIALYQNEDGIDVPAASVFPGYSYRLSAMWSLDNTGTLTATVDASALATVGDVEDAAEDLEAELNAAVTEINGHIEAMQGGLFIVSVGNTHAKINPKQFVYVLDHSTLSEGLYYNGTASAIQQNAALESAGLTDASSSNGGGLNLLSYYKMDCAMSRTLQGENLYVMGPGGYYYDSTCTNIPEAGYGGFVQIFRRDSATRGAIAITDSGKPFINNIEAGMWGDWKELALDSKIGTVPSGKTVQGQIDTLNSNIATSTFTSYTCTSTFGTAYVFVNPFAKIAICKFNAGNNTGDGTITLPAIAKPAFEMFASLRGNGYLSANVNGTITIEDAIAWDAGQIVYPIV